MSNTRKPYPSDVSDDEWKFVAPYLTLLSETASQRRHNLREIFNGVRYIVKTGAHWRMLPHDLPPWPVVYQQTQRWVAAGCFEALVHDLRRLLRLLAGRAGQPSAIRSSAIDAHEDAHTRRTGPPHALPCANSAVGARQC